MIVIFRELFMRINFCDRCEGYMVKKIKDYKSVLRQSWQLRRDKRFPDRSWCCTKRWPIIPTAVSSITC